MTLFQIAFEVLYGNKSFAITEDYTPYPDAAVRGAYNKTVEEPFGKLLKLPTVFVNVTDDGQGGEYDFAIMYAAASDQPSTSVTLQSCDALQLLMQAGRDGAQHREQKPRSRQQPHRLHDRARPANAHPLPRRRRENRRLASVSSAGSQPHGIASRHEAFRHRDIAHCGPSCKVC
jgi:hypothetical protein